MRFKGIVREAHGSTAILAAFVFLVAVWFTAFAADLGSMYYAKREAQAAVDFAAMAAARDPADADAEARKALAANHIDIVKALVIVPGRYTGDATVDASRRFTPNATPANAVMITLTTETPLYFAASMLGRDQVEIVVHGVATSTAQAAFSIGSALARLNGGVLNALLGKLLGTTVSLSAMDYQALLNADVKLFDTLKALSTNAHLGAATYGDVADAQASVGQILSAAATVASGSGQATAASALARLGALASTSVKTPVGSVVDLGPYGTVRLDNSSPGFNPSLNLAQLLAASASVANGGHQVSLDLGTSIPGLTSVKVDAAIGEPMQNSAWYGIGDIGTTGRTAQTRIRLTATVGGAGVLAGIAIRVPLYLEVAYAEGKLAAIHCGSDVRREGRVDVAAHPGVAEIWLGDIDAAQLGVFTRRPTVQAAELVKTPLLHVTGSAHAAVTNTRSTTLSFSWQDIQAGRVRTTATQDALATLVESLLGDLDVKVKLLGLGLGLPGPVADAVRLALRTATPALDQVLGAVLGSLGLSVGATDIRANGLRCDGAALVG